MTDQVLPVENCRHRPWPPRPGPQGVGTGRYAGMQSRDCPLGAVSPKEPGSPLPCHREPQGISVFPSICRGCEDSQGIFRSCAATIHVPPKRGLQKARPAFGHGGKTACSKRKHRDSRPPWPRELLPRPTLPWSWKKSRALGPEGALATRWSAWWRAFSNISSLWDAWSFSQTIQRADNGSSASVPLIFCRA